MYRNKKLYDFSDYKDDHVYNTNNNLAVDKSNKTIIRKFKDENEGIPIIEFVGLGRKIYSIKLFNDKEKKRAKELNRVLLNMTLIMKIIKMLLEKV